MKVYLNCTAKTTFLYRHVSSFLVVFLFVQSLYISKQTKRAMCVFCSLMFSSFNVIHYVCNEFVMHSCQFWILIIIPLNTINIYKIIFMV